MKERYIVCARASEIVLGLMLDFKKSTWDSIGHSDKVLDADKPQEHTPSFCIGSVQLYRCKKYRELIAMFLHLSTLLSQICSDSYL